MKDALGLIGLVCAVVLIYCLHLSFNGGLTIFINDHKLYFQVVKGIEIKEGDR